ncbi:hypothetical protein FOMPIDRAFT_92877 [Fomitopsis schrenkii]|uniref:Uncharacterized protein n=1 Tax=Fomitopsis schrenkii TaxID=2126942 RepID=S8FBW4_FOMSC|nr:hypothetical protein FOMPIDRAFT_92877 [Fomitopsis schrenkii]
MPKKTKSGRIPKPKRRPANIYTGQDSFLAKMQISVEDLNHFREIVDDSILNELDTTEDFKGQDEDDLKRHLAEVERMWTNASKYDGAWPILDYTKYWFAESRKSLRKRRLRRHDRYWVPTRMRSTAAAIHVRDGRTRHQPEVQLARQTRSASSTLSTPPATPRKPPVPVKPHPSDVSRPTREHQMPESGHTNIPFAPVLRFLRSLNPSLEHLAPRFREAGIKDAQRLRAVAGWETRRQWLAEVVELDAFEAELLRVALDEVERGTGYL